ncbi:MAG: hypothetical protein COS11_04925 [bacterium (Candidatus Ratteibacteria) CG01_land_8_20_14_3_00_40_19]|uniref:Gfo/Idh/MocA family oxidoreductase n=1 Tax=bacterium (Candidatus Ratteibacteria) CG01_land_8_20_14_3_00_40_19 TaxID=2014290 RepID=A0A2M7E886_9BACT|nr:MAG: hypothetical protein COS11_04925 [bacterium (Candidatus Ratteibacteria) CG01_land_8_20_14_3_00_40_19]
MKKLGIGVIGLNMGGSHLVGYRNNPATRIVGVCNLDEKKAREKAKEFGAIIATSDYKDLLKSKDIDIISVATPDYFHCEQSVAAMEAGKNVLCEKPMAPTLEDCRKMIETAEKTKRKFMVGQVCRFAPGFVKTKELIGSGEIGELFLVESEYAHNYSKVGGVGGWRKDPIKLREPFLGGGCHVVDLLRWIAGDAEEAFAYSNHRCLLDWPVDDATMAVFKFKNGIIGKVMVSIGCLRPYTMRSVFYGTKGTIISDNTSLTISISKGKEFTSIPVDIASHNVGAEINELVNCILEDKPVITDAREGAKTVATCLAAIESAKTGKPEKVEKI